MKLISFNLNKTYFDCIDEEGNCFVVYWTNLKFSVLNIIYSGLIFSDNKNICIEKSSLKNIPKPIINDNLYFENTSLQLNGNWERVDNPISLLLYTEAKGRELIWNCHHPKTHTTITYKNKTYTAFGYSETLTLPFKPWQLPIDELRWGRFLSINCTIIWINWKGIYPLNKIIFNGKIYEDAQHEENKISFNNGKDILLFENKTSIRKGKLANVLDKMPWLKLIFKSKILNTIEQKYKAKTSYCNEFIIEEKGWSLFEIVTLKSN